MLSATILLSAVGINSLEIHSVIWLSSDEIVK